MMGIVGAISYHLFSIPRLYVSAHSTPLLYQGYLAQEYIIFMVVKDFGIIMSQLFFGGFLGFWHSIVLHAITLPVDILALLGLSIWGTVVLN